MVKFKSVVMLLLLLQANFCYAIDLPEQFDPLGPEVKELVLSDQQTVYYIDEGEPDWQPVVFIGGSATSVRVFALMGYLRTLREDLKLRFISVERNGFGQTEFVAGKNYQDYAQTVLSVLKHLNINNTALLAISGGGPYAASTAVKLGDRISSIHLLAAYSQYFSDDKQALSLCALPEKQMQGQVQHFAQTPIDWWGFDAASPVFKIPGFVDAARDDAARTFSMRGQKMNPDAFLSEVNLFCTEKIESLSSVKAPVYIYYGESDKLVTPRHARFWEKSFSNISKIRRYPNEGHDIQYRHWDQVLIDLAGKGDQLVMCVNGSSVLVDENQAAKFKALGATVGICAWQ